MSSQVSLLSALIAGALAIGLLGAASATDGACAAQASSKHRGGARSYVLERRSRNRGMRIPLPMGPSQTYYDYQYYYARGYYPRHIGGYVYYPASFSRWYRASNAAGCSNLFRRCVAGRSRGECKCR